MSIFYILFSFFYAPVFSIPFAILLFFIYPRFPRIRQFGLGLAFTGIFFSILCILLSDLDLFCPFSYDFYIPFRGMPVSGLILSTFEGLALASLLFQKFEFLAIFVIISVWILISRKYPDNIDLNPRFTRDTKLIMMDLKYRLDAFHDEFNEWPIKIELIFTKEFLKGLSLKTPHNGTEQPIDAWQHPLRYSLTEKTYHLTSTGRTSENRRCPSDKIELTSIPDISKPGIANCDLFSDRSLKEACILLKTRQQKVE